MNSILNNFWRIFADDGRKDRDFSDQESRLQTARATLVTEADELKRAAELLSDIIKARA